MITEFFPEGFQDEYLAKSDANVFRGLHRQVDPHESNKLFFLLSGRATFFAAKNVDNKDHPRSVERFRLSAMGAALVVPGCMFTGYRAESSDTVVIAKASHVYTPEAEELLRPREVFDDQFMEGLILSEKDR